MIRQHEDLVIVDDAHVRQGELSIEYTPIFRSSAHESYFEITPSGEVKIKRQVYRRTFPENNCQIRVKTVHPPRWTTAGYIPRFNIGARDAALHFASHHRGSAISMAALKRELKAFGLRVVSKRAWQKLGSNDGIKFDDVRANDGFVWGPVI